MKLELAFFFYAAVGVGVWIWISYNRNESGILRHLSFVGAMAMPTGFFALLFIALWPLWLFLVILAALLRRGRSKERKMPKE